MDLLLSRYSNIDYINNLPFNDGLQLIIKAHEKVNEDKAFRLYTAKYAMMGEKDFIPFDEFYKPKRDHNVEDKSVDEILSDVKGLIDSFSGGDEHRDL